MPVSRPLAAMTTFGLAGAICVACSLTTDLDGLAGEPPTATEGGIDTSTPAIDSGPDVADSSPTPIDLYRAALDTDKPIAHWPFDEAATAAGARDRISGRFAVARGAVTFGATGAVGAGATFGESGAVEIGDFFDLAGLMPYALEIWVRPDVTAPRVFFEFLNKRTDPTNGYVFYARKEADLAVQFEQAVAGGGRGAREPVVAGAWQHVVLTYEETAGVRLYVNGRLAISSYTDPGGAVRGPSPLRIGGSFEGALDEVAIYDHVLTPERVVAHLQARR